MVRVASDETLEVFPHFRDVGERIEDLVASSFPICVLVGPLLPVSFVFLFGGSLAHEDFGAEFPVVVSADVDGLPRYFGSHEQTKGAFCCRDITAGYKYLDGMGQGPECGTLSGVRLGFGQIRGSGGGRYRATGSAIRLCFWVDVGFYVGTRLCVCARSDMILPAPVPPRFRG